jgi:hypothetical protein
MLRDVCVVKDLTIHKAPFRHFSRSSEETDERSHGSRVLIENPNPSLPEWSQICSFKKALEAKKFAFGHIISGKIKY